MQENDDYFGFSTFEVDGKVRPMSEYKAYIEESIKKNVTCAKKLKIGDVVILKKTNNILKITAVDYKIMDGVIVDYEGEKINEPNKGGCYYFNQKDIEKIIKEREEER